MTTTKPLIYFKQGEKFMWNGHIHTVYAIEGNMCEVFVNSQWRVWPVFNGREMIKVSQIFL